MGGRRLKSLGPIAVLLAGALLAGAALAGCSDGIEVNSKLLDSIGSISGVGQKKETRLQERAGLVIPPPMAALPEPGSGDQVAAAVAAGLPQDPEAVAARDKAQAKLIKAQACKDAQLKKDQAAMADTCEGLLAKIWGASE
jgi:hypothetical protein